MCWLQELLPLVTLENSLAVLDRLLQPQNMIPSTRGEMLPSPWVGRGAAGGSDLSKAFPPRESSHSAPI